MSAQLKQFLKSCRTGDLATVTQSVAVVGVNSQGRGGTCGLMWSINADQMPVLHYLLSLPEIDVNLADREYGFTAAHYAVSYYNREEALRTLVAREDIDLTVKDSYGDTPKEMAAAHVKCALVALALV